MMSSSHNQHNMEEVTPSNITGVNVPAGSGYNPNVPIQYTPNQQLPYPYQHVPYPNQQVPYPNQQVPYPNQQVPYPNQQVPYPNQQVPYPNQQVPYYNQQVPYPNQQVPCTGQQVPDPHQSTENSSQQNPNLVQLTDDNVLSSENIRIEKKQGTAMCCMIISPMFCFIGIVLTSLGYSDSMSNDFFNSEASVMKVLGPILLSIGIFIFCCGFMRNKSLKMKYREEIKTIDHYNENHRHKILVKTVIQMPTPINNPGQTIYPGFQNQNIVQAPPPGYHENPITVSDNQ